ncbi:MAG: glycosyltransferase family 2 protein [Bacteroidetes bacterium]|nr:glycosyltransferase family 2 protein [Bacteroidota bacterium]
MSITITVIIPTFNRKECLRSVLNCLQNQIKEEFILHTIVVVDGSTDGSIEMIKNDFPDVEIIYGDGNWWYTKCINKGIKRALENGSENILTLNDDIVFDENYIITLLSVALQNKKNTLIGSASFTQSQPFRITFSGIKSLVRWRLKFSVYIKKFSCVDITSFRGYAPSICLSGRGMFFSKEIIDEIGMFDEKFVQYGSDSDFSYRAYKKGYSVIISYDAKVFENEKLTSIGVAFNKPGLYNFYKSFFNIHSSNSLLMSSRFYFKHGYKFLLPAYLTIILGGSFYNLYFKYRNL